MGSNFNDLRVYDSDGFTHKSLDQHSWLAKVRYIASMEKILRRPKYSFIFFPTSPTPERYLMDDIVYPKVYAKNR